MLGGVRDVVTHPVSKAAAVVSVLGGVFGLPILSAVFAFFWANLGPLFTGVSVLGFSIAPQVQAIPTDAARMAAIVVGVGYVGKVLWPVAKRGWDRINVEEGG